MPRNKPTTTVSMQKTTFDLLDRTIPSRENRSNFIEDMILAIVHSDEFYRQLKRAHSLTENEDIFDTVHEIVKDGVREILKKG